MNIVRGTRRPGRRNLDQELKSSRLRSISAVASFGLKPNDLLTVIQPVTQLGELQRADDGHLD